MFCGRGGGYCGAQSGTCGRTSMYRVDMRTIEITLRNAVARGALDNYDVDAAMDGM
jgi:hypothetical protein